MSTGLRNLHKGVFGYQGNHVTGGSFAELWRDDPGQLGLGSQFSADWCTTAIARLEQRSKWATGVDGHWTQVGLDHMRTLQGQWTDQQAHPTTAADVALKVAAAQAACTGDTSRFTELTPDGWHVPTVDGLAAEAAVSAAGAAVHERALQLIDDDMLAGLGSSKEVKAALSKLNSQWCPTKGVRPGSRDEYAEQVKDLIAVVQPIAQKYRDDGMVGWSRTEIMAMQAVLKAASKESTLLNKGESAWDTAEAKMWSQAYVTALGEQREMGLAAGLDAWDRPPAICRGNSRAGTRFTSDLTALNKLDKAIAVLPTDWLVASNASTPLVVKSTSARAHYSEGEWSFDKQGPVEQLSYATAASPEEAEPGVWVRRQPGGWSDQVMRADGTIVSSSSGWMNPPQERTVPIVQDPVKLAEAGWKPAKVSTQMVNKKHNVTYTTGWLSVDAAPSALGSGVGTALHELTHRIDLAVPAHHHLATVHRERRTITDGVHNAFEPYSNAGNWAAPAKQSYLKSLAAKNSEWVRSDGFVDTYIGKVYSDSQGATEVNSMGVEMVLAGTHGGLRGSKADDQHRNFILGLLAAV